MENNMLILTQGNHVQKGNPRRAKEKTVKLNREDSDKNERLHYLYDRLNQAMAAFEPYLNNYVWATIKLFG